MFWRPGVDERLFTKWVAALLFPFPSVFSKYTAPRKPPWVYVRFIKRTPRIAAAAAEPQISPVKVPHIEPSGKDRGPEGNPAYLPPVVEAIDDRRSRSCCRRDVSAQRLFWRAITVVVTHAAPKLNANTVSDDNAWHLCNRSGRGGGDLGCAALQDVGV